MNAAAVCAIAFCMLFFSRVIGDGIVVMGNPSPSSPIPGIHEIPSK